jgi:hypothetical protein
VTTSAAQLAGAVLVVGLLVWAVGRFEEFCVNALASTPDHRLQVLNRQGWIVLILVFIPVGGVMYLTYGRQP